MNRRERLMATLNGKPVDRPAFSFYEIGGCEDMADKDPFNIYSDPSWKPLIELARDKSDRIIMRGIGFKNTPPDASDEFVKSETRYENGSRISTTTVRIGGKTLTQRSRRDPDVNTIWTTEHLLKDADDLRAWLELPDSALGGEPDVAGFLETEAGIGDSGIVMVDISDPICHVAPLFDMGEFTVMALTEQDLFEKALEKVARVVQFRTEAIAEALPGRLWRVVGAEYASPPYLPPELFKRYVTRFQTDMIRAIHGSGGFARVHSHGNLHEILPHIAASGCDGLDPIEPPPQGDVELTYVRKNYGKQMVLFGNLEITDIENLPPESFQKKVDQALSEGASGQGRGFVLMPSACPYGRQLSSRSLRNYEIMIERVERF